MWAVSQQIFPEAGMGVRVYVRPRLRSLTAEEERVREIARRLKVGDAEAIEQAAREMAPAIPAGAVLVPIPGHSGDLWPNLVLCRAIADVVGCRVVAAIRREAAVESSRERRKRGLGSVPPEGQRMVAVRRALDGLSGPILFIDNVVTTGSTFEAARRALGCGFGVAYAADLSYGNTVPRHKLGQGWYPQVVFDATWRG